MPTVIETTVYTFNELPTEAAKERARDWFRECNPYDSSSVIDDAKAVAECFGLEIDKICYTGFASQGDGACFEGKYTYKKGWREALKAYAPKHECLIQIGEALQKAQAKHFYKLYVTTKHRGHYYHANCMDVSVEYDSPEDRNIGCEEDEITKALRDFANWIYAQLEADFDYHNADEQVDQYITANGCTFTEDGKHSG